MSIIVWPIFGQGLLPVGSLFKAGLRWPRILSTEWNSSQENPRVPPCVSNKGQSSAHGPLGWAVWWRLALLALCPVRGSTRKCLSVCASCSPSFPSWALVAFHPSACPKPISPSAFRSSVTQGPRGTPCLTLSSSASHSWRPRLAHHSPSPSSCSPHGIKHRHVLCSSAFSLQSPPGRAERGHHGGSVTCGLSLKARS